MTKNDVVTRPDQKALACSQGLTPKQEAFTQAYVETSNASEAYRNTYNVRETTKPESVWQSASKLLADPKVSSRVEQLQREHRLRHDISVDDLCDEFDVNRDLALSTAQAAAANGATAGKARLLGYDKGDTPTVNVTAKAVVLSDLELARRIASMFERGVNSRS